MVDATCELGPEREQVPEPPRPVLALRGRAVVLRLRWLHQARRPAARLRGALPRQAAWRRVALPRQAA